MFGLPEGVCEGIRTLGYRAPTPVQSETIPAALSGHDLIVQSKTGSGKTAAFGIPLGARLQGSGCDGVQALVLTPTRELAQQDAAELGTLIRPLGHRALLVIGGAGYQTQLDGLRRGDAVVVGTPGRVLDHLERGTFDPAYVRTLVLDEADEMLSMGFWQEVTAILARLPKPRQTMLFSATLPPTIECMAREFLVEPQRIDLAGDDFTVRGVSHPVYFPEPRLLPTRQLMYVMEVERPTSSLLFCNTKAEADQIVSYLGCFGWRTDVIHGDLPQSIRERAMQRLRSGVVDVLVATDIAARGIDISGLSHVVNFGLPEQPELYIHRVGRTGRLGKKGCAITLLSGRDTAFLCAIERRYAVQFERRTLPPAEEIVSMQAERMIEQLLQSADGVEFEQYVPTALELVQSEAGRRAVAFLLREYFATHTSRSPQDSDGTEMDVRRESRRRPSSRRRSR